MKILVTGSSAVTGSALIADRESFPGHNFLFVNSSDCNLLDWRAVEDLMERERPDGIIHLAAVSGGIGLSIKHQASMLRDNVIMNFNVLEAARLFNVRKTVMTLTTGMYPPDAPLPLREEFIHDGPAHQSNYGSSFAKRLIEPAIRGYREEYGVNVVGLAPNGIFGEYDNFNFEDAPMLPTLIRRFYENRHGDSEIVVWGDGTPLREYTYSHDVAKAFMWALLNYDDEQILNSGTTEENSIKAIALMIADILGINPDRITFDTSKPNGVFRKSTDNSKFMTLSGFQYTPFRLGLERTIKWFSETYENDPGSLRLYGKMKGQHDGLQQLRSSLAPQ